MNVLHVETRQHLSGGAKQVVTLMQGLKAFDIQSTLLCRDDSVVAAYAAELGLETRLMEYKGAHDLSLVKKIKQAAYDLRCDLVHAHSGDGTADYSAVFARTHDIPVILTQRTIRSEPKLFSGLKYRSFAAIAGVSQAVESSMRRQRFPRSRLYQIYDGVNQEEFADSTDAQIGRSQLKKEFAIPANAIVIGNIGRFNMNNGQLSLLTTFTQLYQAYPDLHLVLFGDGEMLDELLDFVDDNGLSGRVHFADYHPDMSAWYPGLDILVHTAQQDALSTVILEANANGKPAIAYNTGGIGEIIVHAKTGLLVQPGETDQLADAIARLVDEPELRKKLGKAAAKFCQREFNSKRMCKQYYNLYQNLIA